MGKHRVPLESPIENHCNEVVVDLPDIPMLFAYADASEQPLDDDDDLEIDNRSYMEFDQKDGGVIEKDLPPKPPRSAARHSHIAERQVVTISTRVSCM